jgi:hypothetical protein
VSLQLNFSLQDRTISDGVTQSELSLLDECALKWNYRYNNRLHKADFFDWNFFVGTSWHNFQEKWRKGTNPKSFAPPEIPKNIARNSEFEKTLAYWSEVLPAYQLAYAEMYPEELKHPWSIIEQELSAEFGGWTIKGKIDLASDKPRFIRDFKSTSSAWLISPDGWHFKLQFMLYCWLMVKNNPEWGKKQFEFQMDIMQKPALKQTKQETWPAHVMRVCNDIPSRPEFYLTRKSYVIVPDAIKRFEKFVLTPKIQRLELACNSDNLSIITNPNTNACNAYGHQCEFFNICEKGWDAGKFFFEQRDVKHQELA